MQQQKEKHSTGTVYVFALMIWFFDIAPDVAVGWLVKIYM